MNKTLIVLGMISMLFVLIFTLHAYFSKDKGANAQSKRASIIEVWTNIIIGFSVNFVANLWLIPLMTNTTLTHAANFWGGWIYTAISVLRQYCIRRWFNTQSFAQWLEKKLSAVDFSKIVCLVKSFKLSR